MKQRKKKKKKYGERIKIRDLIRSVTKKSDNYDNKYIKIKLDFDYKLPLNKTIEILVVVVAVRSTFIKIANIVLKLSYINVCIKYKNVILR